MRNSKRFSAILLNTAALFVLTLPLCAQNDSTQSSENAAVEPTTQTILVDEFGRIGDCDMGARLDNFIIQIENNPNSKAHIIIYDGHDVLPSEYGNKSRHIVRAKNRYVEYLTRTRGFAPELITIVDGGIREAQTTELWIVPEGVTPPPPTKTIAAPKLPKNETYLFHKENLYEQSVEFELPSAAEAVETEEAVEENAEEPEADLPDETVEENKIADEELQELKFFWARPNFAETVKSEKGARAVIVYYADEQVHDTNKIYAHLLEGKNKMAVSADLKIENFEIVYGGYRGAIEFELWVVPANGAMPKLTPEEKPQPQTEEILEAQQS